MGVILGGWSGVHDFQVSGGYDVQGKPNISRVVPHIHRIRSILIQQIPVWNACYRYSCDSFAIGVSKVFSSHSLVIEY